MEKFYEDYDSMKPTSKIRPCATCGRYVCDCENYWEDDEFIYEEED